MQQKKHKSGFANFAKKNHPRIGYYQNPEADASKNLIIVSEIQQAGRTGQTLQTQIPIPRPTAPPLPTRPFLLGLPCRAAALKLPTLFSPLATFLVTFPTILLCVKVPLPRLFWLEFGVRRSMLVAA
jgi:hypothetical protein